MKALLLAAAALVALPAAAETIAFTGGTVAIGDGSQPIANGTVVMRDGRIVAAGATVATPPGATVVDARGKWVAAGFVGALASLGIVDGYGMPETTDATAPRSPFSAAIDVSTAINPAGPQFAVERASGVTRAFVAGAASGTIFAGLGALVDLAADVDPVTRPRAFEMVELGENAIKTGGGSRPAANVLLRQALAAARDPSQVGGLSKETLITRADAIALRPVVEGRIPLLAHVERTADILNALALRKEYPALKLVLVGASEGWLVADRIAAAHVPVIAGGLTDLPGAFETLAATQSNVGRMVKAGVVVAVSTVNSTGGGPRQAYLPQYAGNLVAISKMPGATGLDWGQAFASITSRPAEAMGLGGEFGSLRPGRHADVVLWDSDPLELASAPVAVWIDGVAQPMTNRQLRLRDRYATPQEGTLPKAYER